jgi:hypothetical protein
MADRDESRIIHPSGREAETRVAFIKRLMDRME